MEVSTALLILTIFFAIILIMSFSLSYYYKNTMFNEKVNEVLFGKIKKIEIIEKKWTRNGMKYICKITAEINNKENLKEIEFNQLFMGILPEVGMNIKIAKNSKGEYCFINTKGINIINWIFLIIFFVSALFTIVTYVIS